MRPGRSVPFSDSILFPHSLLTVLSGIGRRVAGLVKPAALTTTFFVDHRAAGEWVGDEWSAPRFGHRIAN
jgi:hypothetical protein